MSHQFSFTATEGSQIQAFKWLPSGIPKACVQIAHGMADHAQRYDHFATFLCNQGYAVWANDHRGHGKTAGSLEKRGYFADARGWDLVVDDMHQLNVLIKKEYPDCPIILLGHSMGSFLSRTYIMKYGNSIHALVLSGTASHASLLLNAGLTLAHIKSWIIGKKRPDALLDKMSFGAFNKGIREPRTPFDWLTHDTSIVDAYIADDYCGFVCTTGFFIDLLSGLKRINRASMIALSRKDLPILFIAGSEDPVGNYGKGVHQAVEKFRTAGFTSLTEKIYEGDRHEVLNELDKEVVYEDISAWMEGQIKTKN